MGTVSMAKWLLIFVIFAVLLTEFAASQQEVGRNESSKIKENRDYTIAPDFGHIETTISSEKSPDTGSIQTNAWIEIYLSLGVLTFGLVLIIFTGLVAYKKNSGWDQEATRIFAVSVIVTAGLFLITAGYSDQQIAPMFGLLGTIVGYLLGKSPPGEQGPKLGI